LSPQRKEADINSPVVLNRLLNTRYNQKDKKILKLLSVSLNSHHRLEFCKAILKNFKKAESNIDIFNLSSIEERGSSPS